MFRWSEVNPGRLLVPVSSTVWEMWKNAPLRAGPNGPSVRAFPRVADRRGRAVVASVSVDAEEALRKLWLASRLSGNGGSAGRTVLWAGYGGQGTG